VGVALGFEGDAGGGRRALEESISLFRDLGDDWGVGIGRFDLGKVVRLRGEVEEARTLIEDGLALLRASGDLAQCAEALTDLAGIAEQRGDPERVELLVTEALGLLRRLSSPYFLPDCLELLAGAAVARGRLVRAARLFGAAESLREATAAGLDPNRSAPYARNLAEVRAGLTEDEFTAAWSAGRKLGANQAVDEALDASRLASTAPMPSRPQASGLTPREREVAVLLARGLTNRQIAQALVIADGTVNIHVSNILGKLQFNSRAQVAAWATERGLDDRPSI
jgi:non-specific serine/threonine protein kinase